MESKPADSFAAPTTARSLLANKHLVRLIILNALLLLAIGASLYLIINNRHKTKPTTPTLSGNKAQGSLTPELPVINSQSNTANRYFAGESNAIDFRKDGSKGDFTVTMQKQGNNVVLNWDNTIKTSSVIVYDFGRLDILTDHKVVFGISSYKPLPTPTFMPIKGSFVPLPTIATGALQMRFSPPPVSTPIPISALKNPIPQPYTVGTIPEGLFKIGTAEQNATIFQTGKRYSIEVTGVNTASKLQMASYTFTY